jgi:hypothetical protein
VCYGCFLSDTIASLGEIDVYTFDATAGDAVTIQATRTAGAGTPCLQLFDPNGGLVAQSCNFGANAPRIDFPLDLSGQYTIFVVERESDGTFDYNVALERRDPVLGPPICYGCFVSDGIAAVGEIDVYFFNAAAGDSATIQVTRTGGTGTPCLQLYDPSGAFVAQSCNFGANAPRIDTGPLVFTGSYAILVSERESDDTFDYNLALERRDPVLGAPICYGCVLSDAIAAVGEIDLYTFDAIAGDIAIIQATRTGGTGTPCVQLYDPDGAFVAQSCNFGANAPRVDAVLSLTGPHTILVVERESDDTFDYNLALERRTPVLGTPICYGCLLTDGIAALGEIDLYIFDGTAGDVARVQASRTSGTGTPCIELYDPNGTFVAQSCNFGATAPVIGPTTLGLTGPYTVLVRERESDGTYSYNLSLTCLSGTCSPPAADLVLRSVTDPPGTVARNGSFQVTDTVLNQGSGPAGASTTRYYFSLDATKDASDKLLTGVRSVPAIAGGTESNGTVTLTVPGTTPLGTYVLIACSDDLQAVPERNEQNNCRSSVSTSVVIDNPGLKVISPNGGETWAIGSTQNITWNPGGLTGNVKIELSRTGGTPPWSVLFASTPNDGVQSWMVTAPHTELARIRVTSLTDPSKTDMSDANFTIGGSVRVISPNGGEMWPIGSTQAITWTSSALTGNVKIEISRNGTAGPWATIIGSTPNDGTHSWVVTGPHSVHARVRVTSLTDGAATDTSDADFTIGGSLTVSVPNGGETWPIGSTQTITWTPSALTGNVKIEISRNGTAGPWATIIGSTPNDGTHSWVVIGPHSVHARVRVTSLTDGAATDMSDADLTIGGSLTVSVPNGGETWPIGSTRTITWTSNALTGNVKIEVSRNATSGPWSTIIASTPNDGTFSWVVTGPATTRARVRITSVTDPIATDTSEANFTIGGGGIIVTFPNGGEMWPIGSTQNLSWTSSGLTGNVKIEVSRNGGTSWSVIVATTPNDGTYSWLVTGPATTQARIRVTSLTDPTVADVGNANATIQ